MLQVGFPRTCSHAPFMGPADGREEVEGGEGVDAHAFVGEASGDDGEVGMRRREPGSGK